MRDQTVGFEDFGDLLFGLDFVSPATCKRTARAGYDRAGLADADFTAKLFYIEDFEVQQIAIANDVSCCTARADADNERMRSLTCCGVSRTAC